MSEQGKELNVDDLASELSGMSEHINVVNIERMKAQEVCISSVYTIVETFRVMMERYAQALAKLKQSAMTIDRLSRELSQVLQAKKVLEDCLLNPKAGDGNMKSGPSVMSGGDGN